MEWFGNESAMNGSYCNLTTANGTCMEGNVSTGTPPRDFSPPYALWLSLLLGLSAAIVMVVTVAGNILVLLSFALERNIRQPTNYFIASLAMSDLLIGTFSMPAFTLYSLLGYWPLGEIICDIWLSLDWTVCLASQFSVFFITVDRFFSVKIPAKYRNWRTERKVVIMLAMSWIIPTLIFFTSVIGWQYFVGERSVKPYECEVQFMSDPLFTLFLTLGYYWTFLFIMIGLYAGIYRVALSLQKKAEAKQKKITTAMELAGDRGNQAKPPPTVGAANKNSKKRIENNNARNLRGIESTTFTKNAPAEEDRSSSPAFASDEENSSSGNACATSKTPLNYRNDLDDDDDEQTCFVNSAVQTDTTYRPSLKGMLGMSFNHVSKIALSISGTSGLEQSSVDSPEKNVVIENTSNDNKYVTSFDKIDNEDDNFSEKYPKPTDKLLENDILQGCKYIDEDSFKSLSASENIKLLPDLDISRDTYVSSDDKLSPIWKKRAGRCVLLPEESTMCTSSTIIDEEIAPDNNEQETTPLPVNGSTPTAQCDNKHVAAVKNSNSDKKSFGSPLHALVKSMREKQKKRNRRAKANSKSENRARKALRTITFILGAYLMCWTPYHVMILIIGLCQTCVYPVQIYHFSYWLCYLNSPINPFCYALANQQFKRTFTRILKLDCHRT
ncbi:hypothetical protein FSP39_003133 [Pinctada imbricata]|uniref:G-protein coupled receptors family 1 profile domain-containing protein n=1 Tax=Pinctada imbricata TaxID=66713 RepID=A0AA88YIQ8_PINIB|nr:hypothetical protein FSP39_003133 [Pinctada imbricata]